NVNSFLQKSNLRTPLITIQPWNQISWSVSWTFSKGSLWLSLSLSLSLSLLVNRRTCLVKYSGSRWITEVKRHWAWLERDRSLREFEI
ncbi:MAG: hypothetical protein N7Q72_01750, partial [Spiroplasma sp. Tabriz.8]|nr:hypothetical protein [Spiroplasma sp. Tabriz.8]